ncbi:MAG: membrane protein insertion efficiency factor YidD [Oscillospiraceae bacterium]|jgi:putative membrane protein insertion efficiency factor|nr:membrane protein insertion efficiency factor YidD [Oscillospiraceae bacterium]
MKYIFIGIIKLYQLSLAKILTPCCRFVPSCSAYAVTAIQRYGVFKGGFLAFKRIVRCNPFSAGGSDPVP